MSGKHAFCRVSQLICGGGALEALVGKGCPQPPSACFYFDRQLRLTGVQPKLNFGAKLSAHLAASTSPSKRSRFYLDELGKVEDLWNRLDPEARPQR